MDLRHLKTLITIVETGSFAAAADRLHLTQSAISLHVKALEADTGRVLFDRSTRPPTLTPAGRRTLGPAREILGMWQTLSGQEPQSPSGRLKLGVVPTALTGFLPPALASLNRLAPELSVSVTSGLSAELVDLIGESQLDAAIVTEPDEIPPGLVWHPLVREPMVVLAPDTLTGDADADLLTQAPFLRFRRFAWAGRLIDRHLSERRLSVETMMELDSLEAIERLVASGLGVAVVPFRVGVALPHGVRAVPFGRPTVTRSLGLVARSGNDFNATLLEALQAAIPPDHGRAYLSNNHS